MALTQMPLGAETPLGAQLPSLVEWNAPAPALDPERRVKNLDDGSAALDRLRALHGEAGRNFLQAQLLARVPAGCVVLMLTGASALLWAGAAGGAGLKASFAWAALVLFGVVAMIRLHIRGFARSLRRTPLMEAASDLRLLFLYTGTVWGGGAFLIMPDLPAPALVFLFAVLPSFGLALTLQDAKGFAAFAAPAALLTAGASLVGVWPLDLWVAGAILTAATALALVFLWREMRLRQAILRAPAHS
jgi:hypothetical protein